MTHCHRVTTQLQLINIIIIITILYCYSVDPAILLLSGPSYTDTHWTKLDCYSVDPSILLLSGPSHTATQWTQPYCYSVDPAILLLSGCRGYFVSGKTPRMWNWQLTTSNNNISVYISFLALLSIPHPLQVYNTCIALPLVPRFPTWHSQGHTFPALMP
jgi:hypothetical protein